jgi:hypothetical protein
MHKASTIESFLFCANNAISHTSDLHTALESQKKAEMTEDKYLAPLFTAP